MLDWVVGIVCEEERGAGLWPCEPPAEKPWKAPALQNSHTFPATPLTAETTAFPQPSPGGPASCVRDRPFRSRARAADVSPK